MTATELFEELTDHGVALWEENGTLRFRAPAGVLTDDHRSRMRAEKDALLGLLRSAADPVVAPDPGARHDPFPLTDVQGAYLLGRGDAFDLGGVGCHLYQEFAWPDLDPDRLEAAWRRLVERHDMLRAVIDADGAQRVLPEVATSVPVTDVRDAAPDRVTAALARVRDELDHRVHPVGGPMYALRATRTPDGAVLHLSMDFLVSDWAGISLLVDELAVLHADPDATLAPIGLSFRDYVLAERALRDGPRYRRDRDYWQARVDDLPPGPDLPVAPRTAGTEPAAARFRRHTVTLDRTRWEAFTDRARARGLTPSTAVLTAYATVLERWSRSPGFTLNLTVLNRLPLHADVDRVVGDFTSVSLLAVQAPGRASFAAHAAAVGARMYDDLDHRLHSGVQVLREVGRRRGREAARMPVVFTGAIGAGGEAGRAMTGRIGHGITQTPQVHIDCQAGDGDDGLQVNWDVRDGVFPIGLVEDMFAAFSGLLTGLAGDDALWERPAVDTIALPGRQRAERDRANDTAADLAAGTLHAPVLDHAAAAPDRPAVIGPRSTLTYRELAELSAAVAGALRYAGVRPGERVAVLMDKGPEQIVAVLGALRAGAVYVPVDTVQPVPRRAAVLDDAGVRCVLTQSWVDGVDAPHVIAVDDLTPADAGEIADAPTGPDDPAYVIYTSGSTGRPKGVLMSHRAAANTVADMNARFAITAADRVLGLANLGFDLSVHDVFGLLGAGGALVLPDPARRTDPSHWAELVAAHDVTVWNTVPALMQMLTAYLDAEPVALPSLRQALLSGDWVPLTLPAEMGRLLPGTALAVLGGATEAAIWSNVHEVDTTAEPDPEWPSVPYGRPLANQTFHVLDPGLRDRPEWVAGELCIGGTGLAQGYLGDPGLTAARFVTGADGRRLYRTGDLGRYRPGGILEFLGREDTQVKVRGHRIELGEVEAALLAHPGVAAAVVTTGGSGQARRLLAAVETARATETDPPDLDRVTHIAATAAGRAVPGVDAAQVLHAVTDLDDAVLTAMTAALGSLGIIVAGRRHTADEIAAAVPERNRWLVRRWVDALAGAGRLVPAGDGVRCPSVPQASDVSAAFDRATGSRPGEEAFVDYVRRNADRLPALLDGTQDPVELLFPDGDLEGAAGLYRDHAMARYLNRAVCAVVHRAASAHDPDRGPLRVLEVGAGTGGTTGDVLDALAGFDVDYLFSDVSGSFLPAARARFGDRARYATFDVDRDGAGQGVAPNSADVVLAAGVLENAADIPAALRRLHEVAAPGAWLVITEPTREHPWILASQAFMMTPPADERAGGVSYPGPSRWSELLSGIGDGPVLQLPADEHPLAPQGLHLFATRLKTGRALLRGEELTRFVAGRLPDHMVPSHVAVLDEVPLTGNGKVDRAAVAALGPAPDSAAAAPEAGGLPRDELEVALAQRWAAALGLARVGRTDDLSALGADSLVMAQMTGRLREEVPEAGAVAFDALLRRMLARPDVAATAEFLRAPLTPQVPDGVAGQGSNALLIPFSGSGDGPLRVLFHAGLGTMECYRPMAARLVAQDLGPVTGIAVADPDAFTALEPAQVVEHLADDYAERLAGTGHTRFQLIGYCLGGMYATEVARRLAERGLDVVDLVLVSSHPVVVDVDDELMLETIFVPNLHIDLAEAGYGPIDAGAAVRTFGEIADAHGGRLPAGSLTTLSGTPERDELGAFFRRLDADGQAERFAAYASTAASATGATMPVEMVTGMHRMFRQSFLSARFTPPPYAGDIRFLRPTGPFAFAPGMDESTLAFWRDVCLGDFSVTDVGGDHFSCVEEPVVAEVAGHVAAALVRS